MFGVNLNIFKTAVTNILIELQLRICRVGTVCGRVSFLFDYFSFIFVSGRDLYFVRIFCISLGLGFISFQIKLRNKSAPDYKSNHFFSN